MADWEQQTKQDYARKGFAGRSGYGAKPALLIVDFINGFTDPASPLGGDFTHQLVVTNELAAVFRQGGFPVIYTTIAYAPDLHDAGLFVKKVPSLGILVEGSPTTLVDDRIRPAAGDHVIEKKYASAFFGTDLDGLLKSLGVDTTVMTGCTTSGCIRASAIDSLQYGYHTVVVREGVGDRAEGPHAANLFDIDAKYADVVSFQEALGYVRSLIDGSDFAARAGEDFRQWWHDRPRAQA